MTSVASTSPTTSIAATTDDLKAYQKLETAVANLNLRPQAALQQFYNLNNLGDADATAAAIPGLA